MVRRAVPGRDPLSRTMKGIWSLRERGRGFTLVELLVVIAIIGILATLVLLQLGTARARARDTQRIAHVNQIRTAVEQYYEDYGGQYPADITDASIGDYLANVPTDPLTEDPYGYAFEVSSGKNVGFVVWTQLEQNAAALRSDADLVGPGSTESGDYTGGDTVPGAGSGTGTDADQCNADPGTAVCIYDQGVNF